jgi:beta-lactamase regulating signal transducer with metallopeptidase domain
MTLVLSTIHATHYSFESMLMAVIASSLLLIVISICFVSRKIMVNAGYKLLAVFLLFTLLRFILPLELPISISVHLPDVLSGIYQTIKHVYFYISSLPISVWTGCEAVFLIGALIQLVRLIIICRKSRRYIILQGKDVTDNAIYRQTLERICSERKRKNTFKVLEIDGINTPMIYGIFKPHILIPSNMKLSSDDLYYALSHEAAHHFHHDLLIKAGINILSIVYWWNPAVYVLKKQSSLLLEMRIDNYLTGKDKSSIKKYLECLINISEYAVEQKTVLDSLTLSFHPDSATELEKRFAMLCDANKPKHHMLNAIMLLLTVSTYVLSYIFIFEPYYISNEVNILEEDDLIYYLPLNDTYVIENADGTYSVYLDTAEMPDFFLETFDTLDNLTQGIPVYYLEKYNYK